MFIGFQMRWIETKPLKVTMINDCCALHSLQCASLRAIDIRPNRTFTMVIRSLG